MNVQATTGAEFQRAAELASIDYLIHRSAQYLLDEVFRVFGMKDISLANVLQPLLNAAPALAMYRPAHFFDKLRSRLMSPHGSESMTFSDDATVCIFVNLLWFSVTKLHILFQISTISLYLFWFFTGMA